jgi:hypothetical protein
MSSSHSLGSTGFLQRHHRVNLLVALATFLLGALLPAARSDAYETEHVALVIIDGLRYSEGLGDTNHTYVPKMHELSRKGTIVEPFANDRHTNTMRGIPAIWCGAWTEVITFKDRHCGGVENLHCELPTVFEYYRKQLARPREDCIYILGDVGCPWKASLDPAYGPSYWPLYHSVGETDFDVWDEAEAMLETFHPSFFILYLARVDHFGHSGSWAYYTRAIEIADSIVGMLWEFIESDSVYAGKTTMFVTNDHGRHTDDFTGHDCDCEGCRTVQLLAVGPDIRQDLVSEVPRTLCDIVPTIGELLGFTPDKATGSAMHELLIPEASDSASIKPDVTEPCEEQPALSQ